MNPRSRFILLTFHNTISVLDVFYVADFIKETFFITCVLSYDNDPLLYLLCPQGSGMCQNRKCPTSSEFSNNLPCIHENPIKHYIFALLATNGFIL